ncbi:PREDICTED: properdin [Pseudopodoces humilis]|uniref:properdin n=1 Tax=Pseudopodoces humilis TaxID=181119 RepID=UPI0006B81A3B|nr:PREDICTED: properdin [Pseudopodoces humilis]
MAPPALLLGLALLTGMGNGAATPIWCFTRLEEAEGGGACTEPLGEEPLPLADCCLNPTHGYRLHPHGHCRSCRPGAWGPWEPWSRCSVSCGEGAQRRGRSRRPPGGQPGDNSEWQLRACDTGCCPGGTRGVGRSRSRRCDSPEPSRDPPGAPCPGNASQSDPCPGLPPCPVDGAWGAWSQATPCPVTCGLGGVVLSRACDAPAPKHGGRGSRDPCPAPVHWGPWSPWSPCAKPWNDVRCRRAVGQQRRTRGCVGHSPGGPVCPTDGDGGGTIQVRACYNIHNCVMPGNWSDWSHWGLCPPPCGASPTRSRSRECRPILPDYAPTVSHVGSAGSSEVSFWGEPRALCPSPPPGGALNETRPCRNVPPCPHPEEDGGSR